MPSPLTAALVVLLFTSIAPAALAQVVVFQEDFEDVEGWTLDSGWETSTSSPSTGSGGSNLTIKGNAVAGARSPAMDLSGATSATLTFLARRTASFAQSNLLVRASADGGATFDVVVLDTVDALPEQTSTYRTISGALPEALIGSPEVVLRFEGRGQNASSANARIDDVTITAVVPLEVAPSSLQFFASGGSSHALSLTATNRSGETLTLQAPEMSTSVFSAVPSSSTTLLSGASQSYTITFAPETDGSYSGTFTLAHSLGSAVVALTGTSIGGSFGFSSGGSEMLERSSVAVPLQMEFSSDVGLQGLQFRIEWADAAISLGGVERGDAVSNTSNWMLSHESGAGYVEVVLLGNGTTSLESGLYDPLLVLQFDASEISPDVTRTVELQMTEIVGALATPEGTDSGITPGTAVHSLDITGRNAFFVTSAAHVDLGVVTAGEAASDSIVVSNPDGTSELVIAAVSSTNDLFAVTPAAATLQPNAEQTFVITFSPSLTSFGRQSATLSFDHNGEGATTISATGKGRGGRGDAEGDGAVDAMDVVHAIDFVLDRVTPNPAQTAAADLYPFPEGDGRLDVRDLTLLAQAIARGRWPDDVELPPLEEPAGKGGASLLVLKYESEDASILSFAHEMPIRALQLVIPADRAMTVETMEGGGMVLQSGYDGRSIRILMYRIDGSAARAGSLRIAIGGLVGMPAFATAIGAERERIPVATTVETGTTEPPEQPAALGDPYPNPFRANVDVLRFSGGTGDERVQIFDLLGREVWTGSVSDDWRGSNHSGNTVAPGIYIVQSAAGRQIRPLIVIR